MPERSVLIKANIIERPDATYPVVLKPYKLEFANPTDTTPAQLEFAITNVSSQPLSPRLVSVPKSLLDVSLPNSIPPGKVGQATVKVKRAGLGKTFEKSITLEFDDAERTRFTVPVIHGAPSPAAKKGAKP